MEGVELREEITLNTTTRLKTCLVERERERRREGGRKE